MIRRLSDEQIATLFWGRYQETGDAQAAALTVYEAGRSGATKAVLAARRPRRAEVIGRTAQEAAISAPILAAIAERHATTVAELLRAGHVRSGARFEAMWLMRERGMSFPAIAAATYRKDHTSVIYGLAKIECRMAVEPGLAGVLVALMVPPAAVRRAA